MAHLDLECDVYLKLEVQDRRSETEVGRGRGRGERGPCVQRQG